MRAFWIPTALLTLIVAASLLAGRYVQESSARWISELKEVSPLADAEQWDAAEQHISATYENWMHHGSAFHMLLTHQDLDEAEELFFGVLAACRTKDLSQLHIYLQLLISQLDFLANTQQFGMQNIL